MQAIQSPCIDVCEMNQQGLCGGCLRTRNEIALWGSMTPEQRRIIMESLATRRNATK